MSTADKAKILSTDEAWDNRDLGADERFVGVVNAADVPLNAVAGTQMISIRMAADMIQDLKLIAQINKIGYQTLMKQVLNRFIECEKKVMWNEMVSGRLTVKPVQAAERENKQRKRA